MKIHIVGGSGTGKTYLAEILSRKYNIPHYDLDNLFWDNTTDQYGTKMSVLKRTKLLMDILNMDNWILEGVYYSWLENSFEDADAIIVLNSSRCIATLRIIRRFFKRKIGIEKGKKETLKTLIELLKWNNKFRKNNLPQIYTQLKRYEHKVVFLHNKAEIKKYLYKQSNLKEV